MDRGIGIQELRDFKVTQQEVIGKECYAVRYGLMRHAGRPERLVSFEERAWRISRKKGFLAP